MEKNRAIMKAKIKTLEIVLKLQMKECKMRKKIALAKIRKLKAEKSRIEELIRFWREHFEEADEREKELAVV